jgi:hypothetical protein
VQVKIQVFKIGGGELDIPSFTYHSIDPQSALLTLRLPSGGEWKTTLPYIVHQEPDPTPKQPHPWDAAVFGERQNDAG